MRYHVLAVDYDGTIALHGKVPGNVIEVLKKVKASSRKILLVTGRELDELKDIFPEHTIFDMIVAENGALLYDPATSEETKLGELPPPAFIEELIKRGVQRISTGRVIVATWEPYQHVVLEVIKNSGIERQLIFNKGAVMILPPGVNKSTGLKAALKKLEMSLHNVVVAGDAENDTAMFLTAECSVAVANALPAVKEQADWVAPADHGDGIIELANQLLEDDLITMNDVLTRHFLVLGQRAEEDQYSISPYRNGVMLTGTSGGGKTTLTASFLEALIDKKYQFCLVDPEGDYTEFGDCVVIGNSEHSPQLEEVVTILRDSSQNVNVCLLGIKLNDRPSFIKNLMSEINKLRASKGHPHWLILDEAHHLFPAEVESAFFNIPADFKNFMMITMSPESVNSEIIKQADLLLVVGDEPQICFEKIARLKDVNKPGTSISRQPKGKTWVWDIKNGINPFVMTSAKPRHILQRHKRKYATGDMKENSFYFTGPESKTNLKAQNLALFSQIAEGIDNDTWMFHLKKKEYSSWIRNSVGDEELADIIQKEEENNDDPHLSKKAILQSIEQKYTKGN